ncbi:hypothetical protein CR513_54377, partial [Mucuna pruriens]
MVFDIAGLNRERHFVQNEEEPPNMEAAKFYEMLNSAQQPLWPGCKTTLKARFNDVMKFMKESSHPENVIPSNFRETKKLVAGLGLSRIKIDCCIDGCMLYYKDDSTLRQCKFCEKPRYKARNVSKKNSKDVPYKRLHYLPLIPRLQRLYASVRSAEHMRWHYENRREEEPRNVRLGLCADGRDKDAFYKNRIEENEPPSRLSGEQVWQMVSDISKTTEVGICNVPGR